MSKIPDKSISTKLTVITPETAIEWLKKNTKGSIKKIALDYCVRQLKKKNRIPFTEPILFNKEGDLIHGKTRLKACVRTKIPFSSVVIFNASPVMDEAIGHHRLHAYAKLTGSLPPQNDNDKPINTTTMTTTTTMTQVKQKIMLVTPETAKEFLEKNTSNRPIKHQNVRFIATQMRSGTWRMGPDAIAFDTNDRLINGQHRLLACIETGIPFQSSVMFGLDPETYNVIDTGIKRSGGDALSAYGVKSPQQKSALIKSYIEYRKGRSVAHVQNTISSNLTNQMIVDFYFKHEKKVEDAAATAAYVYAAPNRLFTIPTIGALAYIFNEISTEDCKKFFESFRLGEGLTKGNPVLTLRTFLNNDAAATKKYTKQTKFAMVLIAWNAFRVNKKITRFNVKHDGPLPKPI